VISNTDVFLGYISANSVPEQNENVIIAFTGSYGFSGFTAMCQFGRSLPFYLIFGAQVFSEV